MDLMRTKPIELEQEVGIEPASAFELRVELGHPAADAVRVELRIPRCIERVRHVDAAAVAADLHHLRSAVERLARERRMRRAPHDAADADRAGQPRRERIADVVLPQLAGPPARHVEEAIVERQVDVGDQWRHRVESLEQRRQPLGRRRFGRNLDHLLHRPAVRIRPVPRPDRRRQVLQRGDDADESVRLLRTGAAL
jgi:hypothetical protein